MNTKAVYRVDFNPLRECADLERHWKDLESRSKCEFFLSWSWIQVWLQTYQPKVHVLQVWYGERLVGMALVVKADATRFRVLNSQIILLHQTGNPKQDQIWTEYNGLLSDDTHKEAVYRAAGDFLVNTYRGWDELVVGAITEGDAKLLQTVTGLSRHDLWQAPTFGVDLKALRTSGATYLSKLSRNTRYQINRSKKHYAQRGDIGLERASSKEQAVEYFNAISPLHIARWGGGDDQSGFANPEFVNFHRNLIVQNWDKGEIDLIRIVVGDLAIAYFYNFIYRGRIYFYLSGLVFEDDAMLKPGLLGHALCIEQYANMGMEFYDFMGGGERYKASLASEYSSLFKIALQKRMLKFGLEKAGRRVKHKLLGVTGQVLK